MLDMKLMDTEDELRFYKDVHKTLYDTANIRNCSQLYLTFLKESYGYSLIGKIHWSHFRTIMRLDNEEEMKVVLWFLALTAGMYYLW